MTLEELMDVLADEGLDMIDYELTFDEWNSDEAKRVKILLDEKPLENYQVRYAGGVIEIRTK